MKNNQVTLTKVTKLQTDQTSDETANKVEGLGFKEDESWAKVVLHRKSSNNRMRKKEQNSESDKFFTTSQIFRKHEPLQRTSSAPIKIPPRHKGGEKQDLARVNSVGVGGLSPGGTRRIMYNRNFLLECRQSPLSLTPPTGLPVISGATVQSGKQRRMEKKLLEKMDSYRSNCSAVSLSSVNHSTDDELL